MHILGKEWRDGYLDYHCAAGDVRVQSQVWLTICPVTGVYLERPKSVRIVWEYAREIGARGVIQKIRSRMGESLRNQRFLSVGLGRVVEGSTGQEYTIGSPVAFVAPSHPRCVERLVLPPYLVKSVDHSVLLKWENLAGIIITETKTPVACDEILKGWHFYSGLSISKGNIQHLLEDSLAVLETVDPSTSKLLPLDEPSTIVERTSTPPTFRSDGSLRAVLFGLGNYAKTAILATKLSGVQFQCVHEIDPTQIGEAISTPWKVDTSPLPRDDENYDVYFVAGYHHTHADLAIAALEAGAYAVVEKPLVTTRDQLERLLPVLRKHPGKLFTCFHMRYNPLFILAKKDLDVRSGNPVHCFCNVFEERLPERHWYRWPNSKSHLISNGCHWVDHFLWMNGYSAPSRYQVWKAGSGDTHVSIELENGAVFGMHLTHTGSARIGVQDHVEMRSNGRTVTVDHGSRYLAQGPVSIVRKTRGNRLAAYRVMYTKICEQIVAGGPGDSYESVVCTNNLVLDLEDLRQTV